MASEETYVPSEPKFEVLTKAGSGLFADVVKAKDTVLNRFVALKTIKEEFESSVAAVEHAKVMAALPKHTNVVQIYGIEEVEIADNQKQAVVMEWVEGQSIASALTGPRFSIPQTKKILSGVSDGIEFMHSQKVFHGDLHPGNIVVGPDGEPVIIDASIEQRGTLSQMYPTNGQETFILDLDSLKHLAYRCIQHTKIAPALMTALMDKIQKQESISKLKDTIANSEIWKPDATFLSRREPISTGLPTATIQFIENSQLPSLREHCFSLAKELVSSVTDAGEYPMNDTVSKEEFSRRIEEFETATTAFAIAIGNTSAWSETGDHERIVVDSLQMVAEGNGRLYMAGTYKGLWMECRKYPQVLLFYATLFACYRNERYQLLREILLNVNILIEGKTRSFFKSTKRFCPEFNEYWNSILETNQNTPVESRISNMVQEFLPSFAGSSALAEDAFDELLCFLSAVSLYRNGAQNFKNPEKDWGVSGSHLWRDFRGAGGDENLCDRLILQLERQTSDWQPLKAGFFAGDPAVALQTLKYAKEVHESMRSRLRIF